MTAWPDWRDEDVVEIGIVYKTRGTVATFYIHPDGSATLGAVLDALNVDASQVKEEI